MKPSRLLIVLVCSFIVSCAKDRDNIFDDPVIPQDKVEKKLDTSFLKLGQVGTQTVAASQLSASNQHHVLNDTQMITIEDNTGTISISNFDYNILNDGDLIIGNQNDQYLFKYDESESAALADKIKVTQASLSDFNEDLKIDVNFTPEINYEASEGKSFQEVVNQPTNGLQKLSGSKNGLNPQKKNTLSFTNYDIINTQTTSIDTFNQLAGNKISLDAGQDVIVSIDEGLIELIPTFTGKYSIPKLSDINLEAKFNSYLKYRFKVTVETSAPTMGTISFPLFKSINVPVRTMAGTVPVYADLNISFPAGFKIYTKQKGRVSFIVENEYALNAEALYNSQTGPHYNGHYDYTIKDQKIEVTEGSAHYAFEVYFEPKIKTKLYKVLGPHAYVNTNVQTDIKFPLEDQRDDLFLNFSGGIGLNVDDPIFGKTRFTMNSDSLYNFSKGWDVIGPVRGNKTDKNLETSGEVSLQVDELSQDGGVAIRLKPENASILSQVHIHQMPQFGKLILGETFALDGIAYYYPPQVIEGTDSFQIRTTDRGVKSAPTRVTLTLSNRAKEQAENPLHILPMTKSVSSQQATSLTVGDMVVRSLDQDFLLAKDFKKIKPNPIDDSDDEQVISVPEKDMIYKTYKITDYVFNHRLLTSYEAIGSDKNFKKFYDKTLFVLQLQQTMSNRLILQVEPTKHGRVYMKFNKKDARDELSYILTESIQELHYYLPKINLQLRSLNMSEYGWVASTLNSISFNLGHSPIGFGNSFIFEPNEKTRDERLECMIQAGLFKREQQRDIDEKTLKVTKRIIKRCQNIMQHH